MVASGDWVTPRLDAIKYFEKPALQYWATALAFEVFGQHAWTVRLWPALCGFLGLLLTFALGRRLYDQRSRAAGGAGAGQRAAVSLRWRASPRSTCA